MWGHVQNTIRVLQHNVKLETVMFILNNGERERRIVEKQHQ